MGATFGAGFPCYTPDDSRTRLQLMDLAILHELMHTIGFVPTCARHFVGAGHVSDSPTDLMYQGPLDWHPSVLDVGHDDYFDAGIANCPDLSTSPWLAGGRKLPVTVAVKGPGSVTSVPAGVACPKRCKTTVESGAGIVLRARPKSRARFVGWSGSCRGRALCSLVVLTSGARVTATFRR